MCLYSAVGSPSPLCQQHSDKFSLLLSLSILSPLRNDILRMHRKKVLMLGRKKEGDEKLQDYNNTTK